MTARQAYSYIKRNWSKKIIFSMMAELNMINKDHAYKAFRYVSLEDFPRFKQAYHKALTEKLISPSKILKL
jgi:hypothetical protein